MSRWRVGVTLAVLAALTACSSATGRYADALEDAGVVPVNPNNGQRHQGFLSDAFEAGKRACTFLDEGIEPSVMPMAIGPEFRQFSPDQVRIIAAAADEFLCEADGY